MGTLQGPSTPIHRAVCPGGGVAADLGPVPGLNPADTVMVAIHFTDDLVTQANVTAEVSHATADAIQLDTTDTTGDFVVVLWKEAV